MSSAFDLRTNFWTYSFSLLGFVLGFFFNFYTTGNSAYGPGILGIPLGGLVGATLDRNRMKRNTMLLLCVVGATLIWLKQ